MPVTYDSIATTTLGTSQDTIVFSSIPATYTDLRLVFVGTSVQAGAYVCLRFNSDAGSNYTNVQMRSNGSTFTCNYGASDPFIRSLYQSFLDATVPALVTVDIFGYATSGNKPVLSVASNNKGQTGTSGTVERNGGIWKSTSAINSITLFRDAGSSFFFQTGTTATLYGIKAA